MSDARLLPCCAAPAKLQSRHCSVLDAPVHCQSEAASGLRQQHSCSGVLSVCDLLCVTYIVLTTAITAMQVCPNLDILVPALVEGGIDELEKRCALTPGVFWHYPFWQECTSQNAALISDACARHAIPMQCLSSQSTESMTQSGKATGATQCLACRGGICAIQITPDT